jgi:predicted ATP-grasp superfamily ATP-dependent carboligase
MAGQAQRTAVVPAVRSPSSVAALRSFGRAGVETLAVSEHNDPPAFASKYCDRTTSIPSPRSDLDGYRDALLALARQEEVGAVVPMREEDAYTLAQNRSAFAEHVQPLWPTAEQLRTVQDRLRLYEVARRAGVAVPETRRLDKVTDWSRELIVKARYALLAPAYGGTAPPGRCELPPATVYLEPATPPDVDALVERMGHVPLAQEFLEGAEYSFRALYRNGEPVATSQKRLIRGYKYPRGPSICHEAVELPGLEQAGRALLGELDWHGVASVGFIREGGTFQLLELNPRFWANLPMDIRAGVDYPRYYWQLASGEAVTGPAEYRTGLVTHLLRGELVHLHSVACEEYPLAERPSLIRTAGEVAASLARDPRFDYLERDDPWPFVRDALLAARSVLGRADE